MCTCIQLYQHYIVGKTTSYIGIGIATVYSSDVSVVDVDVGGWTDVDFDVDVDVDVDFDVDSYADIMLECSSNRIHLVAAIDHTHTNENDHRRTIMFNAKWTKNFCFPLVSLSETSLLN